MLTPGQPCKRSGIYRVTHLGHRFSHDVVVTAGSNFPFCKICGDRVRFDEVAIPKRAGVTDIETDEDFSEGKAANA